MSLHGDAAGRLEEETPQRVIIHGNPVDGIALIGPFPDGEAAVEYAERELDGDWWVADLTDPLVTEEEDE